MRRALYSFARLPQAMADMPHAAAEPDLNNSVYAMPDRCATRRANAARYPTTVFRLAPPRDINLGAISAPSEAVRCARVGTR